MRLIPDVSPKTFTLSAVIIGYLLIDDTTANEQNALGNWLITNTPSTEETIIMIEKMICAMRKEIDELKKQC